MLWNSLAIRSRIRSRSVSRDVLSDVSTTFCVFPLLVAPSYIFSICHMSWLWLVFSFSADWEPSRWRRWCDRHWRVSTCLDVWIDWLPSEHFPRKGVVDVTASSFASAVMVMDVIFYRLFLPLGAVVWKGILRMSGSKFLFLMFFCRLEWSCQGTHSSCSYQGVNVRTSSSSFAPILLCPSASAHCYEGSVHHFYRLLRFLRVAASKAFLAP